MAPWRKANIPVSAISGDTPTDVRQAALELLVNKCSRSDEVWPALEKQVLELLNRRVEGKNHERLLGAAARVPLPSVTERLREIALDVSDTDHVVARVCLAQLGEDEFANLLIEDLTVEPRAEAIARGLAGCPLDTMNIQTQGLERSLRNLRIDDPEESNTYFWGSVALAKSGYFDYLDEILNKLDGGWAPDMLIGKPQVANDEIRAATDNSWRLHEYAKQLVERLDESDRARIQRGDVFESPRLNVINALLGEAPDSAADVPSRPQLSPGDAAALFENENLRGVIGRKLNSAIERQAYEDIVANALEDASTNLNVIRPELSSEFLPTAIGNAFVELKGLLPEFELNGQGIIRSYTNFVRRAGSEFRNDDFENQLGWMLAQGDFDAMLESCAEQLNSNDALEQEIAWSLTSKGSAYKKGQPAPLFHAHTLADVAPVERQGFEDTLADGRLPKRGAELATNAPEESASTNFDSARIAETTVSPKQDIDDNEPPRSAYALLDCPDAVELMVEFAVKIGLAKDPTPGVIAAELHRPDGSVGNYKVTIRLISDGFLLRSGEANEVVLDVTGQNPYPSTTLHLTAVSGDKFKSQRSLLAQYSIDGQYIGSAARAIQVNELPSARTPDHTARGYDLSMPPGVPTPDMTISITRGNTTAGDRLVWNIMTPHAEIDVTPPADDQMVTSDIGSTPDIWARNLMNAINGHAQNQSLGPLLKGNGREIRRQIPVWVRRKLRDLWRLIPDRDGSRPTVFIISDEPNIPWELAYLKLGAAGEEDFLGAAFTVGRWVHGYEDVDGNRLPPYPPPTEIRITTMAVVSGDYSKTKHWNALKGAEEEAEELAQLYFARSVNADSQLGAWLSESPDVDAIHFAVHGKWSVSGGQDGIVLVDGTILTPKEVLGAVLPRKPFIFLNACQLGQGEQTLGDYGGIASAFLEAGASGVIAALWNVDDDQARELALDFYERAKTSQASPGQVFQQQRAAFRNDMRSKLALAYQFFGHPDMRLTFDLTQQVPSGR